MDGYANPDRPDLRLSNAEREEAIAHLSDAQIEGRLTPAEYAQRAASVRSAVTRGDLAPLFADLPDVSPGPAPAGRPTMLSGPGTLPPPSAGPVPPPPVPQRGSRALGGRLGDTIMALTPFIALALFKFKIFATSGTMLVSIAAYAWIWGWKFGAGFVLLILVRELGHVFELRRQGVPASAPLFIPFLGAVVGMKQMPEDAKGTFLYVASGPLVRSSYKAAELFVAGLIKQEREKQKLTSFGLPIDG